MAKVLIIDDDPLQRELISDLLESRGHSVSEARNGEEALEFLSDGKKMPDLMLLDVMMPGIDGIETCRRIREREELGAVPVLMLTALEADDYALRALAVGADDFITKSASPRIILARVDAHLRSKSLYDRVDRIRNAQDAIMEIMVEITSGLDVTRVLQVLVEKTAVQVGGRVTVIFVDNEMKGGRVVACSDKRDGELIEIDLDRYPEIRHAFRTREELIIPNVAGEDLLKEAASELETLNIRSMAVLPLVFHDDVMGTLFLRAKGEKAAFDEEDIHLARIIAAAASNAVRNASLIERLKQKRDDMERINDRLKRQNDLRGELFAMTAHDLRAPLAVICAANEAMLDGMLGEIGEECREMLKMSQESCSQLATFARDLQDVSFVESGKLSLKLRSVEIREAVASAVEAMRPLAEKGGVSLSLSERFDDATFFVDCGQFSRILTNLISNAIRHNKTGCRVSIAGEKGTGVYTITVEDDGCGVPEEEMLHIFEDYFASRRKMEGKGLGLYICRKFVEAHGGSIRAERREGGGSRFIFSLPMRREGTAT